MQVHVGLYLKNTGIRQLSFLLPCLFCPVMGSPHLQPMHAALGKDGMAPIVTIAYHGGSHINLKWLERRCICGRPGGADIRKGKKRERESKDNQQLVEGAMLKKRGGNESWIEPYKTLNLMECLFVCHWYLRYRMGDNSRRAMFTQTVLCFFPTWHYRETSLLEMASASMLTATLILCVLKKIPATQK